MTSKVFKTLLSPRFREGCGLAHSGKVEIALPDDHADAMEILCYTLHQRHDKLPEVLGLNRLFAVAVLADKYDCTVPLKHISKLWIDRLRLPGGDRYSSGILATAFFFRQDDSFVEAIYDHFFNSTSDLTMKSIGIDAQPAALESALGTSRPHTLLNLTMLTYVPPVELEQQRQMYRQTIYTSVDRFLEFALSRPRCMGCPRAEIWYQAVAKALCSLGLPTHRQRESQSLRSLLQGLERFVPEFEPLLCTLSACTFWHTFGQYHPAGLFQAVARDIRDEVRLPCLQCVLQGKVVNSERPCMHKS